MDKGTLYIISAPSGGGKTSLVNALIQLLPNMIVSVSYTTRPKRPGELDGINYNFVSDHEFQKMLEQKLFLEHAVVFGYQYGTSSQWVNERLKKGIDVILEIDWQGAQQIRNSIDNTVSIYILPPSREILSHRLRARGQDDENVIAQRMSQASTEISHYHEYDYLIINDNFDLALADLMAVVRARRLLQPLQAKKHLSLLENLMCL